MVLDGPVPVHVGLSAPRVRDRVSPRGIPEPISQDGGLQCPPSASVPLHGAADLRCGAPGRSRGPPPARYLAEDGRTRAGPEEVRGPAALDRGVPARDDRGPEGPGG